MGEKKMKKKMAGEWISVNERIPRRKKHCKYSRDVLLFVPKRDGCCQHGIYIGRLESIPADDGSGNIFGIKLPGSKWSISGWSYYEDPVPVCWMEIPKGPLGCGVGA